MQTTNDNIITCALYQIELDNESDTEFSIYDEHSEQMVRQPLAGGRRPRNHITKHIHRLGQTVTVWLQELFLRGSQHIAAILCGLILAAGIASYVSRSTPRPTARPTAKSVSESRPSDKRQSADTRHAPIHVRSTNHDTEVGSQTWDSTPFDWSSFDHIV